MAMLFLRARIYYVLFKAIIMSVANFVKYVIFIDLLCHFEFSEECKIYYIVNNPNNKCINIINN